MGEKIVGGKSVIVKVSPSEVEHLRDDEVIIVNRAQVNAQLAFTSMEVDNEDAMESIEILRHAINDMLEQEKIQKSMLMGARMTVRQVKQAFSKIETMPQNSFAQIKA